MAGQPGAKEPVSHLIKRQLREETLAGSGPSLLNTSHSAEGTGASSFHLGHHKQPALKIPCGPGLRFSFASPYIVYKATASFLLSVVWDTEASHR